MQTWNRRDVLASLGMMSGAALLTGCSGQGSGSANAVLGETHASLPAATDTGLLPAAPQPADQAAAQQPSPARNWDYQPLDPQMVGQVAYQMYSQGSCMYAVFGSVISQLAEEVGEPFRSFPLEMMRYGATGIGGWGSVCGALNGSAALIGLFHNEEKDKRRDELISNIFLWYESSSLPQFLPTGEAKEENIGSGVAGSVLCHVSVTEWCKAMGRDAFSPERRERCRRLSADAVMKVVELLNGGTNGPPDFMDLTKETHACIECHGKADRGDTSAKMSCARCHQFDSAHP